MARRRGWTLDELDDLNCVLLTQIEMARGREFAIVDEDIGGGDR